MIHDGSRATMAVRTYIANTREVVEQEAASADPVHSNDDFDDVFGSAQGSPSFHDLEHDEHDIISEGGEKTRGNTEWSDVPRLKEKHETEGYRNGITKGKAESVQQGFDEGYSLGATLGLRIGKICGLLEGICRAVQSAAKDAADKEEEEGWWEEQRLRVERLYADAKAELRTQNVFGREWWGEDGIWTFEVPGEGDEGKEVLFPDVVAAHPLVVKWGAVVQEEVETWDLDLNLMEREHEERGAVTSSKFMEEPPARSVAPGAAKELAW